MPDEYDGYIVQQKSQCGYSFFGRAQRGGAGWWYNVISILIVAISAGLLYNAIDKFVEAPYLDAMKQENRWSLNSPVERIVKPTGRGSLVKRLLVFY
jgi:hypothetical protein